MKEQQKYLGKVKLKDMIAGLHEAYEFVDQENYEAAINLLAHKYRIGPNTKNPKGRNPLFLVLEYYDWNQKKGKKIFKFIESLIRAGADPNCQDKYQLTLLHFATLRRSPELCQLLLNNGANPNVLSEDDLTPLDYSVRYYVNHLFPECLSVLLRGGANPCLPHSNQTYNFEKQLVERSERERPEHPEEERLRKAYRRSMDQLKMESGEGGELSNKYSVKDGILYANDGKKLVRIMRDYPSEEIVIPEGVEEIIEGAFSCEFSIRSVSIPESVVSIGPFAFYYCMSLEEVVVPRNVTTIGPSAFCGCHELKSAVLPNRLKKIESSVFNYCPSLETLIIPESVNDIFNTSSFSICPLLKLQVKKGSYAEAYAKENNIPYQLY